MIWDKHLRYGTHDSLPEWVKLVCRACFKVLGAEGKGRSPET